MWGQRCGLLITAAKKLISKGNVCASSRREEKEKRRRNTTRIKSHETDQEQQRAMSLNRKIQPEGRDL
jgi:hypothetical protein